MVINGNSTVLQSLACYFNGERFDLHGIIDASDEPGDSRITTPAQGRQFGIVQLIPRDKVSEVEPMARLIFLRLNANQLATYTPCRLCDELPESEKIGFITVAVEAIRLGARMPA